ncbi:MAG: isocitrate lyase/phosphoenolpyruvate mutase family protein [Pseudorhodoplanes sp.]
MTELRQLVSRPSILVAPGVYDGLTATIATDAGFEALYLSGAAIAYTRYGRPDIGLVSMSEVADVIRCVQDRVATPLIVDADTGYGNALNVQRTMRVFERAGAAALQLEDQTFPKRCGHLAEKSVVSADEMCGKIKAAVDARSSEATLVIARTDALASEGLEKALERAVAYAEAGADILFVEAPKTREQLSQLTGALGSLRPLVANMVEGGETPLFDAKDLCELGFRIVIFPGGIVRALAHAAGDYYASLREHGSNAPFRNRMFDFNGLNRIVGTAQMLEAGKTYEGYAGNGRTRTG